MGSQVVPATLTRSGVPVALRLVRGCMKYLTAIGNILLH